jgi:hypothetical protein
MTRSVAFDGRHERRQQLGVLDDVKSLVSVVQKIDNVELYRKILDLQREVQDLVGENRELKQQLLEVKDKLDLHGTLVFERDAYWLPATDRRDGPFCSLCWDSKRELIRMIKCGNPAFSQCPRCKIGIQMKPDDDLDFE